MAEQICVAIKTTGESCDKRCKAGETRCTLHLKSMNNNGKHTTEIKELKSLQKKEYTDKRNEFEHLVHAGNDQRKKLDIHLQAEFTLKKLKITHEEALQKLLVKHHREIQDTGVDPDQAARVRRAEAQRARDEIQQQAIERQVQQLRQQRHLFNQQLANNRREMREAGLDIDLEEQEVLINAIGAGAGANLPAVRNQELANFSADKQNIHRERTVVLTKEMVGKILAIDVPKQYKWNMTSVSQTPADIIGQCSLTPKAGWQMVAKYCQDESIYDLQKGIYGIVLDGVWQFILKSPHKDDLCKALRQEMEDNVGMCAQGNLSRLCNILSGYMDGMGPQESSSEVLGRLLPKLMDITNIVERLTKAHQILLENKVDVSEWESWLDPLISDQDDDSIIIIKMHGSKIEGVTIGKA